MARFKNIRLGKEEAIGLGDIEESFLQSAGSSFKESFFGATGVGQDVLATEVVSDYLKGVEKATGERLDISKFAAVQSIRGKSSLGDVIFGDPYKDAAGDFEEALKTLHGKNPTKFKLKSLADLKEDYLAKQQSTFAGDPEANKSTAGNIVGSVAGFVADPVNLLVTAAPVARASLGARSLISMLGEGIVQSQVDLEASQKALNIAGAGLGPAAFKVLGIGAKAVKKLASKGVSELAEKSGTLSRNFVKNAEKAATKIKDKGLKEALKSDIRLLKMFKGSTTESLESLGKAKAAFNEYKTIGSSSSSVKIKKGFTKQESPAQKAALEKRIKSGKVSGDELDDLFLGIERPTVRGFDVEIKTTTGKYSTVFDEKTGKAMVYKSSTDAERGLKALAKKGVDVEEMQVAATPKGEFAIVKSSDVSIIPRTKIFDDLKTANETIPKTAKRLGMPEDQISAIKVDGKYRLATHASERDILSAEKGILNSFDEGGHKINTGLSDGIEESLPAAKAADERIGMPDIPEDVHARQLDQLLADDSIKYDVPVHGSKKSLKSFLDRSRNAAKEFIDCIG